MKKVSFSAIFIFGASFATAQYLNIYSVPQELYYGYHNDDFTVCVSTPGGEWKDLYEYKVMVDSDAPQRASMVQFDFEGGVDMRVKVNNGMIHDVKIRPLSLNIDHIVRGNTVFFTLDEPARLSIEINGDRLHNLHIFANEKEKEIPSPDDPDVIYFGPGLHKPAAGQGDAFVIPSDKTVYLAPGAVVQGKFQCDKVENVRFIGRGFVLEPHRGFELTFCRNIEIEGITVINPTHYTVYGGEVDGLKIKGLKSFSCRGWSDGIDLMSCSNVEIDGIFMRNSDDCIAIYAHRWNYWGDARNYTITNAILWADVAHPINIGLHGDTSREMNLIENLRFRDIDILEHDEDDRNYQGCMALSVSDHNFVRDVVFENIRVEDIQEGQLLNMRILYNEKYSSGPGYGIENVIFRNVSYNGHDANPSIIEGYDENRVIRNIVFEDIVINGRKADKPQDAAIVIGNYVKDVR